MMGQPPRLSPNQCSNCRMDERVFTDDYARIWMTSFTLTEVVG